MSWEEMSVTRIPCPCGKGKISQAHYGDDWNRFEDGSVLIECDECQKKYTVESEIVPSYYPGHGDSTVYYLIPVDYPPYTGSCENIVFGPLHENILQTPFADYLIEHHSLQDLIAAKEEYCIKRSSAKVHGVAKQICEEHKRRFHSVKASSIIGHLENAICGYAIYYGSFDQRIIVRRKEKVEREKYTAEKRKHQIKLKL